MNKVKFSDTVLNALAIAMDKNLPFALYIFPRQSKVHFFASTHLTDANPENLCQSSNWRGIAIDFFHPQGECPIEITNQLSAQQLISKCDEITAWPSAGPRINFTNTSSILYLSQIQKFVKELRDPKSSIKKAVLCRIVSCLGRNVINVAQDYFSLFPETFRFLYYTPATGMWLGASPELLLDCDFRSCKLGTMSLAGTKPVDSNEPWGIKNIDEHNIVTRYIVDAMKLEGLEPVVSELYERPFGKVVHLCNDITASFESINPLQLLRKLSPTPALCGFPKRDAMKLIESTETFDRLCYGGWIGVKDDSGVHAYVSLRCASVHTLFDSLQHYCVYTGGGIMPDSNYLDEWNETANKAHTLCSLISLPGDTQCLDDLTDSSLTINPEFKWKKTNI